jgi:phospholipid/cholesterol/gamma-HCH transport system substrate-binding protein
LSRAGRIAALGAATLAAALAALLLFGGGDGYTVTARFINASQLVKGNPVQTGGVKVGSVTDIRITDDGQAEIGLEVSDDYAPLRRGTRAVIRQFSQSGLANRYIDLKLGPAGGTPIPDGGRIGIDETASPVDLDQLFNTLDPATREAVQKFIQGSANQFRGRGEQANRGFQYLNPALSTSSRLFHELTNDAPVLERFLVDSSTLVTALAERRDHLAGLVGNLNETTRALGAQKAALAESIGRLPPFMRRANTTFVNLRAALTDVDPLVEASKPAAKALGPFLEQARGFAAGAEPTVADLRQVVRRRGTGNDLTELVQAAPPLADIAVETKRRSVEPGGRSADVGETRGAFPETVEAAKGAAPTVAIARPFTNDFLGWLDNFSTTGLYDALGGVARAYASFSEIVQGPVKTEQFRRCPGGADFPAPDGSNVYSAQEQQLLNCTEAHRAPGP